MAINEKTCGAVSDPAWGRIRDMARREVGQAAFDSWIGPISLTSAVPPIAVLEAPTNFIGDWVDRHYGDVLKRLITREFEGVERVEFRVAPRLDAAPDATRSDWRNGKAAGKSRAVARPADDDLPSSPLDDRFTFERFVVGRPNELAHAAARRVAESEDVTFNPLFLYGGVGLGKTHLMHAIAWRLRETAPDRRVLYVSAEQFMYRFVQALREKEMNGFKQLFRTVEVLICDDV